MKSLIDELGAYFIMISRIDFLLSEGKNSVTLFLNFFN